MEIFICKHSYNSTLFWNHVIQLESHVVECSALCTKITKVNYPPFVYRLFHEDFSAIVGTNIQSANISEVNLSTFIYRTVSWKISLTSDD